MDANNCTMIDSGLPAKSSSSSTVSSAISISPGKLTMGQHNYRSQARANRQRRHNHWMKASVDSDDVGSSSESDNDDEDFDEDGDESSNEATPIFGNFDCYMSSALNEYVTSGNYSDLRSFMDILPVKTTTATSSPSLSPESSHSGFSSLTESPCPPPPTVNNRDDDSENYGHHHNQHLIPGYDADEPCTDGKESVLSMATLDSAYETKSEMSTLSSSPVSERNYPPLDEALLEEKFAKLGLSKYTIEPAGSAIKIDTETGQIIEPDENGSDDEKDRPNSRAPLIRSTSLKSGRTPPNTPGHGKKVVRFADALGLEFEYIKLISQDEIPIVPRSAYQDLKLYQEELEDLDSSFDDSSVFDQTVLSIPPVRKLSSSSSSWNCGYGPINQRYSRVCPEFMQPIASADFCDRVRAQMVCLENVSFGPGNISVTCVIRVLNIAFEKKVSVRHTLTDWQTWTDSPASYLRNSCDGWSDKFSVTFSIRSVSPGGNLVPAKRVLFAIRYVANNEEYWDDNMGLNYSLIFQP